MSYSLFSNTVTYGLSGEFKTLMQQGRLFSLKDKISSET